MKKYNLILFFIIHSFFLCPSQTYKVVGTLPNDANDTYIYMTRIWPVDNLTLGLKHQSTDSALVKEGHFLFEGSINETGNLYEIWSENQRWNGWLIIEEGIISYIYQNYDTKKCAFAKGTYSNDLLADSVLIPALKLAEYGEFLLKQQIDKDDHKLDLLINEMQSYAIKFYERIVRFVHNHINTPMGEYVFLMYSQIFKEEDVKKLIPQLSKEVVEKYYEVRKTTERQVNLVGKQYIPFTGVTPNKVEIKLSNIIAENKLTLLDFWASWCAPCIKEMPVLVELYNEYKDKGLEIIGISTDTEESHWVKAIEKYNMTWIQVISGSETENNIVEMYDVRYIPQTILIDNNGMIIDVNLREKDLIEKIKEILQ